ncbi:alpha/beta hydrolase [Novosphingobium kaempferiae]|uniref:alpha/beta hydrolase n=1 Tax=Novosphingobium kaempferiae TaxID=2896849 RepID=UPI001E45F129|nr:alpha/beta hydrolase-fold protein [Novosphingobium kaempferiae]
MRRLRALLAIVALMGAGPLAAAPWQLERSDVETVAAVDGHAYRVMVAWPEGEPPTAGWPVLWLLDGEDNFAIAAVTARRLERAGARSGIQPGVIVAIESGGLARRVLDYTPSAPGYAIPKGMPAHGLAVGGGDAFLDFVDRSLRPRIAGRLRIDPRRQTLMGHSFGALLALDAMYEGRAFSHIVAVSPSLWYGDGVLRKAEAKAADGAGAALLLASAPSERTVAGLSGTDGKALVDRWRAGGRVGRYLSLPGQTHGSTMMAAMTAGIAAAFGKEAQ